MKIKLINDGKRAPHQGQVEFHETMTPVTWQRCMFSKFGCSYQGLPDELTLHNTAEEKHHLTLTLKSYNALVYERNTSRCNIKKERMELQDELSSLHLKFENAVIHGEQLQEHLDLTSSQLKLKQARQQTLENELNVKTDEILSLTDKTKKLSDKNDTYLQTEKYLEDDIHGLKHQLNDSLKQNAQLRLESKYWFDMIGVGVFTQVQIIPSPTVNVNNVQTVQIIPSNQAWRSYDGSKQLMIKGDGWLWKVLTEKRNLHNVHNVIAPKLIPLKEVSNYYEAQVSNLTKETEKLKFHIIDLQCSLNSYRNENRKLKCEQAKTEDDVKSDIIYLEYSLTSYIKANQQLKSQQAKTEDGVKRNIAPFPIQVPNKNFAEMSVQTDIRFERELFPKTSELSVQTKEILDKHLSPQVQTYDKSVQTEHLLKKTISEEDQNQGNTLENLTKIISSTKLDEKMPNAGNFGETSEKVETDANKRFDKIPLDAPVKKILTYMIHEIHNLLSGTDEDSVYSFLTEEFYTATPGYKLQFRIVLFENKLGFDFRIKKGVFDEHLQWPFKEIIKLFINTDISNKKERINVLRLSSSSLELIHRKKPVLEKANPVYKNKRFVDISKFIEGQDELSFDLVV